MGSDSDKKNFSAEEFVDSLLLEGVKVSCDETEKLFNQQTLPDFYDERLYKRGHDFYYKHIFALWLGKLLGLLSVLTIPSIVKLLIHTNMSSSAMTAFRRYLLTLLHVQIWYNDDFTPGSRLWKSINEIKKRHNSASKKGCASGLGRISQKDMALTQFGFMGYAVTKREKIGFHYVTDEEWQGFIHIWRVVGYVLGIEDRFNICRDSVEETRAICNEIINQVYRPAIERKDKDFLTMSGFFMEGMWSLNPMLNTKAYLAFLHDLVQPENNNNNSPKTKEPYIQLTFRQKMVLYMIIVVAWSLRFTVVRLYYNYVELFAMWLREHFPFLGYYNFGYANSQVVLFPDDHKVK